MCLYRFIKIIHLIKLTQLDHDREYTIFQTRKYEWIDILEMKQEDIAEISKNMISITIG